MKPIHILIQTFGIRKTYIDDISHDLKMIQNIHKIFKKPEVEFKEVESRR